MEDFVTSIFNVFKMVNKKAERQQDKRLKIICLIIFNYVRYMAKEFDINLIDVKEEEESINLIPVFEYVAANNIELYDFSNIDIDDIDVTKKDDLERFVLSHIYYITQVKNNI
jgi:predicted membrane-bound spermidine synthase